VGTDRRVQTRQKGDIHINRCKTREEQKMLLHNRFKMYNFIPNEIKNESKLQNFRSWCHILGVEKVSAIVKVDKKYSLENAVLC